MPNLQELIAQKTALSEQLSALEKQIADAQKEQRQEAIAKVRALLGEFGLTVADLAGDTTPRAEKPATAAAKVAPKFRDTATGQTWSGRGLKPRWLTAAIAAGKKVEDFAI